MTVMETLSLTAFVETYKIIQASDLISSIPLRIFIAFFLLLFVKFSWIKVEEQPCLVNTDPDAFCIKVS